jgi:hypothetical protein
MTERQTAQAKKRCAGWDFERVRRLQRLAPALDGGQESGSPAQL